MIKIFTLRRDKINSIKPNQVGKGMTWIRCVKPDEKTITLLSKISKIPLEEFKESIEEEERPKVSHKKYLEIIYRAPFIERDDIITLPVYFYICKNLIITVEKQPDITLDKISELMKTNKRKFLFRKGQGYFIFYVLDAINDRFLGHIDKIADNIELFQEKRVLSDKETEHIYDSSVALSYFNQALLANIEVLNTLKKSYFKVFKKKDRELFAELYFDALHILDTEKIQREVISNLFNLQSIISANRLNVFMKRLASLALIVMIPTLITGMYGMNFHYLPLKEHPYGFYILALIMLTIVGLTTALFVKIDWL